RQCIKYALTSPWGSGKLNVNWTNVWSFSRYCLCSLASVHRTAQYVDLVLCHGYLLLASRVITNAWCNLGVCIGGFSCSYYLSSLPKSGVHSNKSCCDSGYRLATAI